MTIDHRDENGIFVLQVHMLDLSQFENDFFFAAVKEWNTNLTGFSDPSENLCANTASISY